MRTLPTPQIPLRWRAEIGSGYSGPTVAEGRVYVTDYVKDPEEQERVHCFDAATGKKLWTYAYPCAYKGFGYPAGPRASVTLDAGRAYALGARGHLHCLDATTGALLWKKDPETDYKVKVPVWGIASAPLVYDDLLIVQLGAEPDACLVALDKASGSERWRALEDPASYSAPIVIQQAGRDVLLCWTGAHFAGLDPTTGEVFYKHPTPPLKMVINVPTPVLDEKGRVFLPCFYDGAYLFQLAQDKLALELLWHRRGQNEKYTDALHSMISTPLIQGEYIYGVDSYGELRCLDIKTGDRIWEDLTAVPKDRWATIHMVKNGEEVWMFNERGELLIARLDPEGFHEISRSQLISPTTAQLDRRGGVCWSHPAYADKHIFARNDDSLVCASLAEE
jgi:outer membrane protein assembly factor BamB